MGHYKLTERFTSRDGRMEVDPREYGMTQHGLDVVGDKKEHLGGATQIFTRIDGGPGVQTDYFTRDNKLHLARLPKPESGWCTFDMTHGNAGYNPEQGQVGWWNAKIDGTESDVAAEIGLPHSWHVSTFLVFTWAENGESGGDGGSGPEIPVPPVNSKHVTLITTTYNEQEQPIHTVIFYSDGSYEDSTIHVN